MEIGDDDIKSPQEYLEQVSQFLDDKYHRVSIKNISNIYVFNKLNTSFGLNTIENDQVSNARKSITLLINRLRYSGYFSKINLRSYTYKRTIIFSLDLELNNILTEIEFINTQNLLIPKEELDLFTYELIGYPTSLTQLKLLSQKIKHWYFCRGFRWIEININTQNNNICKIYYLIIEGVLDKITYKLCPLVGHDIDTATPLHRFVPTDFVNSILKRYLEIGAMPTFFNIEKAMHTLKDTRFFYNFYYDVDFNRINQNIEIIIYFVPYRDYEIQATLDKIIQKMSVTNIYEERINELINDIYIRHSRLSLNKLFLTSNYDIQSINKLIFRYIYGNENKYILNKVLMNFDIQNSLYNIELGLDENFHLNQYHSQIYFFEDLRYLKTNLDFINFTFKERDSSSEYDLSYDTPLNINKKVFFPLATRIFDNITKVKSENHIFKLHNTVSNKRIIKSYYEFRKQGVDFLFKRKFKDTKNLNSTLGLRISSYNQINFLRNHLLLSLAKKKFIFPKYFLQEHLYKLKLNFIDKKEIFKSIVQNFKLWNFRIQFPFIDDLYHPTTGHFTQADFLQLQPNRKLLHCSKQLLHDNTYTLLFFKHISYFRSRPRFPQSPYHLILFKLFYSKLYGQNTLYSLPDRLRYQRLETRDSGYKTIMNIRNYFSEYLIEYHLRISQYTNPVFSIKFFTDSPLFEEYPFPHVQGEFFYSNRLDLFPVSSGIYFSLGWEFRTIIAQIPAIRVELIQEVPGKVKICLRAIPYLY
uniref:hypothetical protein n=1 Tax=Goniotrichopsis reniformis TaxID=468933 RepID=UPI001FCCFC11|nr:hypothetical protein MW428_pgp010 [Goniotrichopsis reniformis]UNJ14888.1 hypothetical protein [Goniotrichopsis reniformis]